MVEVEEGKIALFDIEVSTTNKSQHNPMSFVMMLLSLVLNQLIFLFSTEGVK